MMTPTSALDGVHTVFYSSVQESHFNPAPRPAAMQRHARDKVRDSQTDAIDYFNNDVFGCALDKTYDYVTVN